MQVQEVPNLLTDRAKGDQATLEKLSSSLRDLKSQTVTETEEVVGGEVEKLNNFAEKIGDVLGQISKSKARCQETIRSLKEEEKELSKQVEQYKKELMTNDVEEKLQSEIKSLEKEYIKVCKSRIAVANSLDVKKLKKIEIEDRKSQANEVFKWVLAAIYTEPESKFYWPNFQEQALGNDKGADFMERLGKVSAMSTREEQRVKTDFFLEHEQGIKKAPELKNIQEEVEKIFEIAKCFRKGYEISQEIADCNKKIEKHKEMTLDKDQENLRSEARISALEGRIDINKSFLKLLEDTEASLSSKIPLYRDKAHTGALLLEELKKLNSWTPLINLENDPNKTCEGCRLF